MLISYSCHSSSGPFSLSLNICGPSDDPSDDPSTPPFCHVRRLPSTDVVPNNQRAYSTGTTYIILASQDHPSLLNISVFPNQPLGSKPRQQIDVGQLDQVTHVRSADAQSG